MAFLAYQKATVFMKKCFIQNFSQCWVVKIRYLSAADKIKIFIFKLVLSLSFYYDPELF